MRRNMLMAVILVITFASGYFTNGYFANSGSIEPQLTQSYQLPLLARNVDALPASELTDEEREDRAKANTSRLQERRREQLTQNLLLKSLQSNRTKSLVRPGNTKNSQPPLTDAQRRRVEREFGWDLSPRKPRSPSASYWLSSIPRGPLDRYNQARRTRTYYPLGDLWKTPDNIPDWSPTLIRQPSKIKGNRPPILTP